MPLVREAARAFQALHGLALKGADSARTAAERAARERRRILAETARGFVAKIEAAAPDVPSLIAFDTRHRLGMDPGAVVSRLRSGREERASALAETENGRSRFSMQRFDAHRDLRAALADQARAALDVEVARQAIDRFDPAFLATHAAVQASGASPPPGVLAGRRLRIRGLLARGDRVAAAAVRAYASGGRSYVSVRDGEYLPMLARHEALATAAEEAEARSAVARARASNLDALMASLDGKRQAAATLLEETDAILAAPYVAVLAAARDWLAAHVTAFETQAALRDPGAAEPLSRMVAAGLLAEDDLTEIGRRFLIGQDQAALVARERSLEGMGAKVAEALGRLRRAEGAGRGGSFVELDVPAAERSLRAALAGLEAEVRAVDGRQFSSTGGAGKAPSDDPGTLLWWMLASASGGDANSVKSAVDEARSLGGGDPMRAVGVRPATADPGPEVPSRTPGR